MELSPNFAEKLFFIFVLSTNDHHHSKRKLDFV